jgi:hypothetical protein
MAQSKAYLNGPHLQKNREGFYTGSGLPFIIHMPVERGEWPAHLEQPDNDQGKVVFLRYLTPKPV